MSLPIRLLPEAKAEFDEAADWYEEKRPGLAVEFLARIGQVIGRISIHPERHGKVYQDVRKAVVTKFPYIVLYQIMAEEILVVAIHHGSRDSANWQKRV